MESTLGTSETEPTQRLLHCSISKVTNLRYPIKGITMVRNSKSPTCQDTKNWVDGLKTLQRQGNAKFCFERRHGSLPLPFWFRLITIAPLPTEAWRATCHISSNRTYWSNGSFPLDPSAVSLSSHEESQGQGLHSPLPRLSTWRRAAGIEEIDRISISFLDLHLWSLSSVFCRTEFDFGPPIWAPPRAMLSLDYLILGSCSWGNVVPRSDLRGNWWDELFFFSFEKSCLL